jgi:hypothetical protein
LSRILEKPGIPHRRNVLVRLGRRVHAPSVPEIPFCRDESDIRRRPRTCAATAPTGTDSQPPRARARHRPLRCKGVRRSDDTAQRRQARRALLLTWADRTGRCATKSKKYPSRDPRLPTKRSFRREPASEACRDDPSRHRRPEPKPTDWTTTLHCRSRHQTTPNCSPCSSHRGLGLDFHAS